VANAAEIFGSYRLLSPIGRGGMGVTWKAQRLEAGPGAPLVVVKRILPALRSDPELIESFVNEAHVTAALSHPSIAQVLDFGRVGDEFYFAVEFVHGRTVEALLAASAARGLPLWPVPVACLVTQGVLSALQYAHTRLGPDGTPLEIVHRDISPDNVLLSFEGEVKVVDFGVAKARLRGREETAAGLVKGKWTYFSPEQATGERLDGRSDLFAVGVMLYRMVCGRLPFEGELFAAVNKMRRGELPSPLALNPTLPAPLVAVIERALATNREQRFQAAHHMSTALQTVLDDTARGHGAPSLRAFVRWAFERDLKAEGLAPAEPAERAGIAAWLVRSSAAVPVLPEAEQPQRAAQTQAATSAGPKQAPSRRIPRLAYLGLFLLGAAAASALVAQSVRPPREAPPIEFLRGQALGRVETLHARLETVDPPVARQLAPRVAGLRFLLQGGEPGEQFVESCALMAQELERALAVAPPPAPLPPRLIQDEAPPKTAEATPPREPGPIDWLTATAANEQQVTLTSPRHNVLAAQPLASKESVATLPPKEPLNLFNIGELLPVGRNAEGKEVLVPLRYATPGRQLGFSQLRFLDFRPLGGEVRRIGKFGVGHESTTARTLEVQAITTEAGHFLVLDGLEKFPVVQFRRREGPAVVLLNCGGETFQLISSRSVKAPKSCALALLEDQDARSRVTVTVARRTSVLEEPVLPRDSDWDVRVPMERNVQVSDTALKRAQESLSSAVLQIRRGRMSSADASLTFALREMPQSAELNLLKGVVNARLGNADLALQHYRTFLALAPTHRSADSVRKLIAETEREQGTTVPSVVPR
jgi:eukaryotic-like serine/threonine-protein kinase